MDTQALQARLAELFPGVEVLSHAQVQEAFATLAAETVDALKPHTWMEARGIYETFGPFAGEEILARMEALGQREDLFGRIMRRAFNNWIDKASLDGNNGGVDLGSASTRQLIPALISQTEGDGLPFTAEQAATLLALAEIQVPRWQGLTLADLEALYLPAWEAAYQAEQAAIQEMADQLRAENPALNERTARDLASYRLQNPDWNQEHGTAAPEPEPVIDPDWQPQPGPEAL